MILSHSETMFRLLMLLCAGVSVLADPATEKCKGTDGDCMTKLARKLYSTFFDDSLGLDPMHHDVIDGSLSILKYKLSDTYVRGYKNCEVESASSDLVKLKFQIVLLCPHLSMAGKYELKGRLIILPIEGTGDYKMDSFKYRIKIDMNTELQTNDGKTSMNIKSFTAEAEPLEGVKFAFNNLFNGNKALSDAVHKYANENWKDVAKNFQAPIINAEVKKIISVSNKLLKNLSVEDYLTL